MSVKNIIPGQKVTKEKQGLARELRRKMTPAEKILWGELRANKLGGPFSDAMGQCIGRCRRGRRQKANEHIPEKKIIHNVFMGLSVCQ